MFAAPKVEQVFETKVFVECAISAALHNPTRVYSSDLRPSKEPSVFLILFRALVQGSTPFLRQYGNTVVQFTHPSSWVINDRAKMQGRTLKTGDTGSNIQALDTCPCLYHALGQAIDVSVDHCLGHYICFPSLKPENVLLYGVDLAEF